MLRFTTFLCCLLTAMVSPASAGETDSFTLVVMDPLAGPLACDCVQGYAQRKYEKLGEYLRKELGVPVNVVFNESLATALKEDAKGQADLVIGKHSVVKFDAKKAKVKVKPIAALTGKDGKTTQQGLVVVRSFDAARKVGDLKGYRIFFGPKDCDEKHTAPLNLFKEAGVKVPKKLDVAASCADGAATILELDKDVKAATVISSYAEPLLEGCGTIKKGDLRVIGATKPLPFITAFANTALSADRQRAVRSALLKVGENPEMLIALESRDGFVKLQKKAEQQVSADAKKKTPATR